MFSTNLPTETLYKTSFTLGVIIFVFTITYRIESAFRISNLKKDHLYETIITEINDSIKLEKYVDARINMKSVSEDLSAYDSILNSDLKKLDKKIIDTILYFQTIKIDSLKNFKKEVEVLDFELTKDKIIKIIKDQKFDLEYEKHKAFIEWQSLILITLSLLMTFIGLIYWRKIQIISDKTSNFNLEKIQLEVKLLELQKKEKEDQQKPVS